MVTTLSPNGGKAETIAAYDAISREYREENSDRNFWRDEFGTLLELLRSSGIAIVGGKFLDLGCGTGRDVGLASGVGMNYVGVDLSRGMLNAARRDFKEGTFLEMDVTELQFEANAFDVVWAAAVMLHLNPSDLSRSLREISRVLKPDHFAFISVEKRQEEQPARLMKESVKGGKLIRRYFALYTESEFRTILGKWGFEVVKVTSKMEPGGEKEWLCFFVRNDRGDGAITSNSYTRRV